MKPPSTKLIQTYPVAEAHYDDEIDLYALWRTLFEKKFVIIFIALFFLVIGGGYAFLSPPTYEVKATFIPPTLSDVAVLDTLKLRLLDKDESFDNGVKGSNRQSFMALNEDLEKRVYNVFKRTLYSYDVKRYVLRSYLKEQDKSLSNRALEEASLQYNNKNIKIIEKKSKKGQTATELISIKLLSQDKTQSLALLTKILDAVKNRTREQLLESFNVSLNDEINHREGLLVTYTKNQERIRANKIIRYTEASKVAHALDITDGSGLPANMLDEGLVNDLLYLRGFRALDQLILSLKARKNDEPFTPKLVKIKGELELLKRPIDRSRLTVVRVDENPKEPFHPIKPKKQLILALSLLLGLMAGVGFVLFSQFLADARERYADN